MNFFELETRKLLNDDVLVEDAICTIFDTAVGDGDNVTLERISRTYPMNFLEGILKIDREDIENLTNEGDE